MIEERPSLTVPMTKESMDLIVVTMSSCDRDQATTRSWTKAMNMVSDDADMKAHNRDHQCWHVIHDMIEQALRVKMTSRINLSRWNHDQKRFQKETSKTCPGGGPKTRKKKGLSRNYRNLLPKVVFLNPFWSRGRPSPFWARFWASEIKIVKIMKTSKTFGFYCSFGSQTDADDHQNEQIVWDILIFRSPEKTSNPYLSSHPKIKSSQRYHTGTIILCFARDSNNRR